MGFLELRQEPGVYSRVTAEMSIRNSSLFIEVRNLSRYEPRPRAPEGLGEMREEPSSSWWGLEPALPLGAAWLWARNRTPLSLTLLAWTIKMVVLCLS